MQLQKCTYSTLLWATACSIWCCLHVMSSKPCASDTQLLPCHCTPLQCCSTALYRTCMMSPSLPWEGHSCTSAVGAIGTVVHCGAYSNLSKPWSQATHQQGPGVSLFTLQHHHTMACSRVRTAAAAAVATSAAVAVCCCHCFIAVVSARAGCFSCGCDDASSILATNQQAFTGLSYSLCAGSSIAAAMSAVTALAGIETK